MRSDLVVYLIVGIVFFLLLLLPHWHWRRRQEPHPRPQTDSHKTRTETFAGFIPKARMRAVRLGIRASLAGAWRAATPDDLHPRATAPY